MPDRSVAVSLLAHAGKSALLDRTAPAVTDEERNFRLLYICFNPLEKCKGRPSRGLRNSGSKASTQCDHLHLKVDQTRSNVC